MSEAYYLSGCVAATPVEALAGVFAAGQARPAWVEETFWLAGKSTPLVPEFSLSGPLSTWSLQPGLDALLLQNAGRILSNSERRMLLLVQQTRTRCAAVLLAGPLAIGVYNLAPLAQILPGWTLPPAQQPLAAAAAALRAAGVEPDSIRWLAGSPPPQKAPELFPAARPAPRSPAGVLFQLVSAAQALKKTAPLALLHDAPPGQPQRVLLLERL